MTTPQEGEPEGGHGPTPDGEHAGTSDRGPAGAGGPGTPGAPRAPGASTADGGSAPDRPTALHKSSWQDALKRTLREFRADNLSDWGAALTYYGVLAIFPALLALVSVLGLLGSSTIKPLIDNLGSLAPGSVRDVLTSMLEQMENSQGGATLALVVGIVIALWSASGYVAAFMRASNAIYDIGEGRPVWKTLPVRLGITVVVVVLLASRRSGWCSPDPRRKTGQVLGLGDTALTVWNFAKWPVLVILVALIFAILYWAAPNVRRAFRWVTPGSLLAVVIWLMASAPSACTWPTSAATTRPTAASRG